MTACNVEVIKSVGRYYNAPVGTVCYNTEKVLTTVLNKQNVEGFASIVLKLVTSAGIILSQEQMLLSYQWLEHIAMYANQAAVNPMFAKSFLKQAERIVQIKTVSEEIPLPQQILPHELKNVSLDEPVVFFPQPFSYPGYPVVLYL
ncbi:unnamed protein product [Arctia plantaginis]|uniref:Uncharacterized protein n=1 Tax=Arctia plantaginis TaxID=874455 RepID=A0A8S0ZEV6_ARCPL|nr:unnamed protein product [Arctia plantaginis]